jgi:glycosyltransferase involved in cell wall biosynthesis/SAM-dependent methyltransferase
VETGVDRLTSTPHRVEPSPSSTHVLRPQGPSVAVVLTTHNHRQFLGDAIESVLAQTRPADEILVVDDGSTDDPAAIVGRYRGIKLLEQANQGLSAARNAGMLAVGSEKAIFLDADDRLLPDAIASGLACFAKAPASGFVYGAHRRIHQDGRVFHENIYHPISPQAYHDLLKGNLIGMHGAVMYDRGRLLASGGFDPTLPRCEDYDVYLRMSHDLPVASHPEIVAEYRWHGGNMSSDHREMLKWALHVHKRAAQQGFAQSEMGADWRRGRRFWRQYYAEQICRTARADWGAGNRSIGHTVKSFIQATSASPAVVLGQLARIIRTRAVCVLPAGVISRLTRGQGKRPTPQLGSVKFGDLDGVAPICPDFGFDRGTPIDRYYIEEFLSRYAIDITGRVLEVGDDSYCRRFGGSRITRQDVLHVTADNPSATIVGDLSIPGTLPGETFDCLVLTQTLHLIFDLRAAVREIHQALKPNGVALLTVPGISPVDGGAWKDTWFWSLTPNSASRLFSEVFGAVSVRVETHGNVFAATAFLQGLAVEEVDRTKLKVNDVCFPVIVAVRAQKGSHA